jgi:tetratricopeptide (TPR) repeat protein
MADGMKARLILGVFLVLAAGAQALAQRPEVLPANGVRTFLVLPFENARPASGARFDWLGEGLAERTAELLAGEGRLVFPRQEWLGTVDRLGLPASSHFSRATMLKIAEEMDADYVVFGSFASDGKSLALEARMLRVVSPALTPALREEGSLEELMETHARLAWRILARVDGAFPLSQHAFVLQAPRPRLDAFEYYVRGVASASEAQKLRLLREAARLEPEWDLPSFALGQAYLARRDCASALPWFSRVFPAVSSQIGGRERRLRATFLAGVCHLLRNDAARADSAFSDLGDLPEALNNRGVALARQGKWREAVPHWQRAAQLEPAEAAHWFNLGLAAFQAQEYAAAVRPLREASRRRPDDAQARALLVAALERAGRASEAQAERESAPAELPRVAADAGPQAAAALARVTETLDAGRAARVRQERQAARTGAAPSGPEAASRRDQHVASHLARGRELAAAGRLAEAEKEFAEAILLAPQAAEPRMELAEVYHRQGRVDDSVRELRAALWSRDAAAPRIRLARLLIEQGRPAEARAELEAALRLNLAPAQREEARKLLETLAARPGEGERR